MRYPLTLCTYSVLSYSVPYRTLSNKEPLLNSLDVPLACSVRCRSSARKCLADVITKNFFQHICQWMHHHQFLTSFAPSQSNVYMCCCESIPCSGGSRRRTSRKQRWTARHLAPCFVTHICMLVILLQLSRLSNGLPVRISKNIPTPKTAY